MPQSGANPQVISGMKFQQVVQAPGPVPNPSLFEFPIPGQTGSLLRLEDVTSTIAVIAALHVY